MPALTLSNGLARIRKAITAGLGAGLAVATAALSAHGKIEEADAIEIVGSVIVVGFLTWLVPNKAGSVG